MATMAAMVAAMVAATQIPDVVRVLMPAPTAQLTVRALALVLAQQAVRAIAMVSVVGTAATTVCWHVSGVAQVHQVRLWRTLLRRAFPYGRTAGLRASHLLLPKTAS